MQALILAAGKGTRLREMTETMTKCMVDVNGESIIGRLLKQVDNRGLSKIVIVVGYLSKDLIEYVNKLEISTPIEFIDNTAYDSTNNIYSFALAENYLCEEDTYLFESDLIMDNELVDKIFDNSNENFAVIDQYDESWMDGTCVCINNSGDVTEFIPKAELKEMDKNNYYKTVNIYKFSKEFCKNNYLPELFSYMDKNGKNDYYERVLKDVVKKQDVKLSAVVVEDEKWYEVDTQFDLKQAKSIFN